MSISLTGRRPRGSRRMDPPTMVARLLEAHDALDHLLLGDAAAVPQAEQFLAVGAALQSADVGGEWRGAAGGFTWN